MTKLLLATLAASVLVTGCGTSASDSETPLVDGSSSTTVTTTTTTKSAAAKPKAAAAAPKPAASAYVDVTIPSGTMLQLSLNTAVASDTSNVEDAVSADLTSAVIVDGRT